MTFQRSPEGEEEARFVLTAGHVPGRGNSKCRAPGVSLGREREERLRSLGHISRLSNIEENLPAPPDYSSA